MPRGPPLGAAPASSLAALSSIGPAAAETDRRLWFTVSKVFWLLAKSSNLIVLLLVAGTVALWLGRAQLGASLVTLGAVPLVVLALLPLGSWLPVPLENRLPAPAVAPERVDGVIVLGGALLLHVSAGRQQPALTDEAEWVTARVEFGRRYPNARLSKKLVGPRPGERWPLMASAYHMPRSVGVFRRVGWPVILYPVDYRTTGRYAFDFSATSGTGGRSPTSTSPCVRGSGWSLTASWGGPTRSFPRPSRRRRRLAANAICSSSGPTNDGCAGVSRRRCAAPAGTGSPLPFRRVRRGDLGYTAPVRASAPDRGDGGWTSRLGCAIWAWSATRRRSATTISMTRRCCGPSRVRI